MTDHSHYEELAALEAGGFLSDAERIELSDHTKTCPDCLRAEQELRELAHFGLPLTVGAVRQTVDEMKTWPDRAMRSRFLQRARLEGISFSPGVNGSIRRPGRRVGLFVTAATALAVAIIVAVVFRGTYYPHPAPAQQQADRLRQENSALTASLSELNKSLVAGQREIQNLRAQLANAATTAENLRRDSQQARGEAARSSSQNAQLLDETRTQEKLLAQARDEAARISQLRLNDDASLAQQEARITELSNKLRIASATLDMERQLATAGQDVRELMVARQLHVVDVHDTDSNGKPSRAFGRVFLTEGKSFSFYAFDLNEDNGLNTKSSFQVWAVPEGSKNSARSLGFLQADAKAPGRWVLNVKSPELVKGINSVYVTAGSATGGKQRGGPKMLYAYLGTANHS
jgi:anti-sigma factor RsiW